MPQMCLSPLSDTNGMLKHLTSALVRFLGALATSLNLFAVWNSAYLHSSRMLLWRAL